MAEDCVALKITEAASSTDMKLETNNHQHKIRN
jgi:hypothetical protein